MNHYDVLIVGGGPSGSTCARHLIKAGLHVGVIDKKDFPRDKVCAGWVTPAVLDALDFDQKDYRQHHVFQPIRGFETSQIGARAVSTRYESDVSYGIRRVEFDDYLLRRSGAAQHTGKTVRSIIQKDGIWCINDELTAPMLVGAGGHFCPVAKYLGAKVGATETIVAAHEIEFKMTPAQRDRCLVAADTPELFFCDDLKGYGWIFRKHDVLNIGLGRESSHNIAAHVEQFRDYLSAKGRIPPDTPTRFKGHAYILYNRSRRRCFADGVILAGDAIGLAYTQSGEGIRPAVESALMAAQRILDANGDYSAKQFSHFETELTKRFGPRGTNEAQIDWVPESIRHIIARKLLTSSWFSRHVVLNRWFLHTQTPTLELRTYQ